MNLKASFLYAHRIIFSHNASSRHEKRSILGAVFCIALSLIPLVTVIGVSNGMINGMVERMINLSTGDIRISVDDKDLNLSSQNDFNVLVDEFKNIKGVTSSFGEIDGVALASANSYRTGIYIRSVGKNHFSENSEFAKLFQVVEGTSSLQESRSILLSKKSAEILGVHSGDTVRVVTVKSGKKNSVTPKSYQFKITGIVSCGYQELDALWAFISIDDGFQIIPEESRSFYISLGTEHTFDFELERVRKDAVSAAEKNNLYGSYVETWKELNASQTENFNSTKTLLLLIMILIVLVAAVNISAAIIMITMERRKEIAILKCLGGTCSGITMSFIFTGMFCALAGIFTGIPLGLFACVNINSIIIALEKTVNFFGAAVSFLKTGNTSSYSAVKLLDPAYYIQVIEISIPWMQIIFTAVLTLVLSFIVSIIPSVKAGQEKPLETLRKV